MAELVSGHALGQRRVAARSRGALGVRSRVTTWLAVAPAALALLVVVGYVVADGVRLSFTDWGGVGAAHWVGADNYRTAADTPAVRSAILLTLGYATACALGMVVIASLLAAAVSARVRGSSLYRIVWFLPSVAPATAVAVFWSTALQPESGAVNSVLGTLGLGSDHAWLADPATAIYPVIAVSIWCGVGFAFLLLLGAIEQIPSTVFDAARVDGASQPQQFLLVTLPLIRPVLVVCALLELIWAANGFAIVWAMTQGGPGDATQTLPILIYKQAFSFGEYGLAGAMAVLSGVVLMVIGLIGLRLSRSAQEAAQ